MTIKISWQGVIFLALVLVAFSRYPAMQPYFQYLVAGFVLGVVFAWFNYEGFNLGGGKKKGLPPHMQQKDGGKK